MVSDVKNFVLNNLDLIITLLIIVFSFLWNVKTSISNHKKLTLIDVLRCVPVIVAEAEKVFDGVKEAGSKKMEYCLQKLETICTQKNVKCDFDMFRKTIESVLLAPSKIKNIGDNENVEKITE